MEAVKGYDCDPTEKYIVCFDDANAKSLVRNINAMQDWIDEAWIRCGTPDAKR